MKDWAGKCMSWLSQKMSLFSNQTLKDVLVTLYKDLEILGLTFDRKQLRKKHNSNIIKKGRPRPCPLKKVSNKLECSRRICAQVTGLENHEICITFLDRCLCNISGSLG